MDFLLNIMENSSWPMLTAFLLGLAVAVHPCPLATNIAAMGYIARHAHNQKSVLVRGLYYVLGRMAAYSLLGIILVFAVKEGALSNAIGKAFGEWGERLLAPLLIIIGLYFILSTRIHKNEFNPNMDKRSKKLDGRGGSFILGAVLALSFCPESAIVFFGMLIPLSAKSSLGYVLPVAFSAATAIPAVLMAWMVAYGISSSSLLKKRMAAAQQPINIVVGVMFIGAGLFCCFF